MGEEAGTGWRNAGANYFKPSHVNEVIEVGRKASRRLND
jgi:hypothetical protein